MILIRSTLFSILLLLAFPSQAITAIFFQPQASDQSTPLEKWTPIFNELHKKGFDTLVVQWAQYGNSENEEKDREWLIQVLTKAKNANLKLILGLSADPDVFNKLQQTPATLEMYLQKTYERDQRALLSWTKSSLIDSSIGWYIPLEVDDREWRAQERRTLLKQFLDREVKQIQLISKNPVYISSFFTGNMTPINYSKLLTDLKIGIPLKIWVQDGGGTKKLSSQERSLYFQELNNCNANVADGIIFEIFKQTEQDQTFTAEPLRPAELAKKLKFRAPCNRDSIFFELRYLIDPKK
ncbi:MAG: hypothetical protein RL517_1211 [Pseudomonadota bacterium]